MPGEASDLEGGAIAGSGLRNWRRFPRLPLVLVLLSLGLLAVLPILILLDIDRSRARIDNELRPAREALAEIQSSLGIEAAATRAFILSGGDPTYLRQYVAAKAERVGAFDQLQRQTSTMDPEVAAAVERLEEGLAETDRRSSELYGGDLTLEDFLETLPTQHRRLVANIEHASVLEEHLLDEIRGQRIRHERLYRFGLLVDLALLLLVLLAAFQVYRLGKRFQALAFEFERIARRRSELIEALAESEERFRQLGDHIDQVIWLASPGLERRYYLNPAYERVWGRSVESAYADPLSPNRAIHPEDYEAAMEKILGVRHGDSYDIRFRIIRPDGSIRWIRSRGYPVRNMRGEVYRIAGISEDITENIEAEEEREELLEREKAARADADRRHDEIERITESRERLIRGLGHDLKNPISAADGYLQLLERQSTEAFTDRGRLRIENARRALHRALDLLENLLDLARAEAGSLVMEFAPVEIGAIVEQVAEEYRAQAEAKGLRLEVRIPRALPEIASDGRRIAQILGNLLSNALKYTDEGRIEVEAGLEDARVAVRVRDTGMGIAERDLSRIFLEYQRAAPHEEGAGIGLAISQLLARALGGEITVESVLGKGSTFTLWLPLERDS